MMLSLVWVDANDITDPLFASTNGNEIAYYIRNRTGSYLDTNTSPTTVAANRGQFAFYKVDGVDKAYYIKCIDTDKWLTYDNTKTGTDGKGFVTFSDTQDNYFIMEGSGQSNHYSFRIRPVNESGEANNFLNWHGGESGYTQTIGLWNSSGGDNVNYTLEQVGATTVTDVSKIANDKYYYISSLRGSLTLNADNTATISDRTDSGTTINASADPEASKWAIVTYNGNQYLYNLKARKFLGSGSSLADDITGAAALTLADLTTTYGERRFKFTQTKNVWLNNNNSGTFGLLSYSSEDNGNRLRIREAGVIDDIGTVTSLSKIRNDRLYTLTSARGGVVINSAATGICSSTNSGKSTEVGADLWALLTFNNNKFFYNLKANKFLRADNTLAIYANESSDAMTMVDASSPSDDYKFKVKNGSNYLNNNNSGDVAFDSWYTEDSGNRLSIVSVCEFDPSSICSGVTFEIYCNDEKQESAEYISLNGIETFIPDDIVRDYVEYDYNGETTIMGNGQTIRLNVNGWNGPFELSSDYDHAHWYDMAVRSNWYVTSGNVDSDNALKTIEANALGLAEDAYQWAFVGDPYHIKLYNKAVGSDKVYAWTSVDDKSIPGFIDANTENYWWIRRSTSTIANSFMLTIPDYGYQVNQYGGAGGSLKIWAKTGLTDVGSAFTAFEVPSNFAAYATAEIKPFITPTGYFTFTDAVKTTTIGWQDSYETDCPFATYKAMKEALSTAFADASNFVYPQTGYYRIKSNCYKTYIRQTENIVRGNDNGNADQDVASIVYLARGEGNKLAIKLQGSYIQAPTDAGEIANKGDNPHYFIAEVVPNHIGIATFWGNSEVNSSALHSEIYGGTYNQTGQLVGWEKDAEASRWIVEDATTFEISMHFGENSYWATMYAPFGYTLPEGTQAYIGAVDDREITLTSIGQDVPANTAVVIKGNSSNVTATINDNATANTTGNALQGQCLAYTAPSNDAYTLGINNDEVGFYKYNGNIKANKAVIKISNGAKGFKFVFADDDLTGVGSLSAEGAETQAYYDLQGRRVVAPQKGQLYIRNGKVVKM